MPESTTHVSVAVAVIQGRDRRFLLTKRSSEQHMGGLWEFPGGKIEDGETVEQALSRELEEELGITPEVIEPFLCVEHSYPEKKVTLHVFNVISFSGNPENREGQPLVWARKEALNDFDFPSANRAILNAIALPDKYAITGAFLDSHELFDKVNQQLKNGFRLIQFRANHLTEKKYLEYAGELSQICLRYNAILMIKGEPDLLDQNWCMGVHLRTKTALKLHEQGWKQEKSPDKKWLAVSCHNSQEVKVAEEIGADFVTLSPVCLTQTHPDVVPLGFTLATEITKAANIPVYWLGGLTNRVSERVSTAMAQGIAAIRAFWPE